MSETTKNTRSEYFKRVNGMKKVNARLQAAGYTPKQAFAITGKQFNKAASK